MTIQLCLSDGNFESMDAESVDYNMTYYKEYEEALSNELEYDEEDHQGTDYEDYIEDSFEDNFEDVMSEVQKERKVKYQTVLLKMRYEHDAIFESVSENYPERKLLDNINMITETLHLLDPQTSITLDPETETLINELHAHKVMFQEYLELEKQRIKSEVCYDPDVEREILSLEEVHKVLSNDTSCSKARNFDDKNVQYTLLYKLKIFKIVKKRRGKLHLLDYETYTTSDKPAILKHPSCNNKLNTGDQILCIVSNNVATIPTFLTDGIRRCYVLNHLKYGTLLSDETTFSSLMDNLKVEEDRVYYKKKLLA